MAVSTLPASSHSLGRGLRRDDASPFARSLLCSIQDHNPTAPQRAVRTPSAGERQSGTKSEIPGPRCTSQTATNTPAEKERPPSGPSSVPPLPGKRRKGERDTFVPFLAGDSNRAQCAQANHPIRPANAASVTGMPKRAKSQNEILIPISRACCTTMMLETLPITMRLPPKLFASAKA